MSGPDRDAAAEALTILRILLPLAGRSAFELGVLLAGQPPQQQKDAAARSVVRSFVGEAQELLLRHVFDLGLTKVRDLHGGESTRTTFEGLTGEAQDRVRSDLLALKDAIVRLDTLEHARGSEWLAAVVACLEATETLVEHGLFGGTVADEMKQALALPGRPRCWWTAPPPGRAGGRRPAVSLQSPGSGPQQQHGRRPCRRRDR